MNLFIPVMLGTAREGRRSEYAARFVVEQVKEAGIETELIDVKDHLILATEQEMPDGKEIGEKLLRADGYIVVSPEYNHGYPGELKLFLDSFYDEFARKPIAFCGVSTGLMGGARAVEQLKTISIEFHMVPMREAVYFFQVKNLFDEQGSIKDESYKEKVKKMLDELTWFARALREARNSMQYRV